MGLVGSGDHDEIGTGDTLAPPSRPTVSALPAIYLMAPNPEATHTADAEQVTRTMIETIQKWMVLSLGILTVGLTALMISGLVTYNLSSPDSMKRPE